MRSLKQFIKRTPIIKVWRSLVNKRERAKLERFNKHYRKYILPLKDPEVLEQRIKTLNAHSDEEKRPVYLISLQNERIGIFGYINNILPHIAYAVARGYIPVVDMKNYHSIYQVGNENAWESFFEQPVGIGLDEITGRKIICSPNTYWWRWQPNSCPVMTNEETRMWARLYKEYVRYNAKAHDYLKREIGTVLEHPQKTVAALYRGTDYSKGHAVGHPIQPTMKRFADAVENMMEKHGYEWIYLASDERGIVEYMNHRFPGKVLINKRVYYDEAVNVDYTKYNIDHIGVSGAHFDRDNNEFLIGIEYISSMNLAANCDSFVAGACGGTTAVLYMNGLCFKDVYIFNLGKYGFDPIPEDE